MPLWPCWRLVRAGWATIDEAIKLDRMTILDANDLLDAQEEAQAIQDAKDRPK